MLSKFSIVHGYYESQSSSQISIPKTTWTEYDPHKSESNVSSLLHVDVFYSNHKPGMRLQLSIFPKPGRPNPRLMDLPRNERRFIRNIKQDHVKSTLAKHPKVFAVATAVPKSLWQRMKNQLTKSSAEAEDLDNLAGVFKMWGTLKGPKKKGMDIEVTAHVNDVRFHFIQAPNICSPIFRF